MNTKKLYIINLIFPILPPTRLFNFKSNLLRWAGAKIGKNVKIVSSAKFYLSGGLEIGDNTWIGEEVLISGGDALVSIGKDVDIGPRVTIITGTHELFTLNHKAAGRGFSQKIIIEDGVWIGASSTIISASHVKKSCMIAAGSLVRGIIEERTIAGGVPAKSIKTQNDKNNNK